MAIGWSPQVTPKSFKLLSQSEVQTKRAAPLINRLCNNNLFSSSSRQRLSALIEGEILKFKTANIPQESAETLNALYALFFIGSCAEIKCFTLSFSVLRYTASQVFFPNFVKCAQVLYTQFPVKSQVRRLKLSMWY